jgi:hypothetical protein
MKIAIFVEGQTELVFVREMLLTLFEHTNIHLECYNLFTDTKHDNAEYPFPNQKADFCFEINNVGNDNRVLQAILKREQLMWNSGFDRIIGLRDMYSRNYKETLAEKGLPNAIDTAINQAFITGTNSTIQKQAKQPDKIYFHYSIMEIEAWILGMYFIFKKFDGLLTSAYIKEKLGFDLAEANVAEGFFRPAEVLDNILGLSAEKYEKSKSDINSIAAKMDKMYLQDLLLSGRCPSFNHFYGSLAIPTDF